MSLRYFACISVALILGGAVTGAPQGDELPGADMPEPPVDARALLDFAQRDSTQPEVAPQPDQLFSDEQRGELIASYARRYIGIAYRTGGSAPESGFDCSGLSGYVYKLFGYDLPRSAKDQFDDTTLRLTQTPATGDLIFFRINRRTVSHVGLYIGGGLFVHAPRPGRQVEFADLNANYWQERFAGARTFRTQPD
ncbi:MAG: C40 family peptidase [Leptospirales bacterium]|nr:C40 family peptidase [Leptospirales bacterium]